ncbi:MAG: DUF3078 domain-containing protein [Bacteroidota bacterium]
MTKILYLVAFLLFVLGGSSAFSQTAALESVKRDTTSDRSKAWKRSGFVGLNFTQVSLSNWSAGGSNSISGLALFKYAANYKDEKNSWDNFIDLAYGISQEGDDNPRKSDDKLDISTKYGRFAFKNWYYSALAGFRSQFAKGYNYPNDSVAISNFLAPGYLTVALGMDYRPNDFLTVLASPCAGRMIIVNDDSLAALGSFGVDSAKNTKLEIGAMVRILFKKDIIENVGLINKLELYTDYMGDLSKVDVNWEITLNMKVNEYISANLTTHLIYDEDTKVGIDSNDDGSIDTFGPRTQFKEVLGVGLSYKF